MATSSFFYGGSSAPEQNTLNALIADLEAKVTAANEASVAAQASANAAAASSGNAHASEVAAASSLAQAQLVLVQAQAAQAAAESALAAANAAITTTNNNVTAANAAKVAAEAAQALAQTAATNAQTSATNAATSATNASTSATAASSSATSASGSASSASTSATNAASSASAASTSATNAASSEANALTYKNNASTSATNAASSASAASSSATAALSAQTAAESARDATLTAYDNFDDRYLGAKSSDPSVDNDGNPLIAGALYFNTTVGYMKIYTGSAWVDGYAPGTTFLAKASNLSDLPSVSTARTNLGLGTAALVADSTLVHTSGNETIAGVKTFSSTIIGSINGNAGTATALQNARLINGTSFNGGANINVLTYTTTSAANSSYHVPFYGAAATNNQQTYLDTGGEFTYNPSTNVLTVGTGNSTNWNTAYGWGNHASAGYASTSGSYADPAWITSLAYSKLTGAPTIPTVPTNVSAFTNDAGYVTASYADPAGTAVALAIALG